MILQRNKPLIFASLAIPIIMATVVLTGGLTVHAQTPDFILTATPSSLCVNPGVDAVSVISVQSIGGFASTVDLRVNVDPTVTNGPMVSAIPSSETLAAGQTVSFNLAISTTTSTPDYTYNIPVSGFSGGSFHQATVQLTVAAGCSVGGTALSIDRPSLLTPYAGVAILSCSILAIAAMLLLYRRQNKRNTGL